MSIGPTNPVIASLAGTSLAQTKGSDVDRNQQAAGSQQTRAFSAQKAESAAGIGETDGQDHEAAERDADGRLPWRSPKQPPPESPANPQSSPSKDASGESGSLLDLCG